MSIAFRAHHVWVACVTLLLAACDRTAVPSVPSLTVVPIAVVDLDDPESAPLGAAGGLLRTADGGFFVSDRQRGTLLQFTANGRRVQEIGRRGSGPGEWETGPFGIFAYNDSMLAVSDGGQLKVFSPARPAAGWVRAQSPVTAAFAASGGMVLSRRIDRERRTIIARYRGPADSAEFGGPFPSQVGRSRMADLMLVFVAAARTRDDSLAVFTQGSDYLFVGPYTGPFDSVHVPRITRRGAMPDVLNSVRDDDPESGMRAAYKASFPLGVYAVGTDGRMAVLTIDQEFLDNRMAGALHVAVVNARTRAVCGEARVPVETDPQPWAVVAGDTLFALSQDIDTTTSRSIPRVRKFRLVAEGC
jgi:hypothetical protein